MASDAGKASRRVLGRDARLQSAERRCADYRRAFQLILDEPFDDLDKTIDRMLQILATTLDVGRVSFWTVDTNYTSIRCEHVFTVDRSRPLGATLLKRADCPTYFETLCQELVIAADDARNDPRTCEFSASYLEPLGVVSLLDVPVRAFGRYVGVLCHEQFDEKRSWTREDEHFASGVATQIALAYERDRAKRAQEKLLERSLRDEESQLANRVHLEQALTAYLQNPARAGAVLIMSADQHSFVASCLGARRMQLLLREFAGRLAIAGPDGTLVARTGTNQFAMLLRGVEKWELPRILTQVNASLTTPLVSEGQRLFFTLSGGYAYIDSEIEQDAETLLNEAQMACHEARAAGGDRATPFTAEMRHAMRGRISLEQDLRRALDAAEFDLHFQPIVSLNEGGDMSLEALLRWRHPRLGVLSPESFIQVAIDSGIMLDLGRRVLANACTSLAKLQSQKGMEQLGMTVNMSAPEVLLPGTAEAIQMELLRNGLPARALTIEITETAFMVDLDRAASAIAEIREIGVSISLDDFGTAYSSLSWLRKLAIDKVKIDRSFVAGIENVPEDLAIVRSVVDLTRAFKRDVVAEGVENLNQLRILRALGVDHAQGYLFSRPEPLEKFDAARLNSLRSIDRGLDVADARTAHSQSG
ncbi:MAG TPA: GGDEF and EAL domain-containing protein [Steroidobacteraceae bacterium]|nr:GGDEF and EAL domain-containing protein [Steroidobacteraceae bacterium]